MKPAELFIDRSIHHLRSEYLPRIRQAIGLLSDEEVWWRPNAVTTCAGNLLLHLEGNVRQWILSGIGGQSDRRVRQAEFDTQDGAPKAELLERLAATVNAACEIIARIIPPIAPTVKLCSAALRLSRS